jgi:ABC-type nickel/cobalt efflux system permease component RcnA
VGRRSRSIAARALAAAVAIGFVVAVPAVVLAHPLGNFTINHYAEVRVEVDRVQLDVVIDQAEIPTFQARFDFDLDGDASLSDEEIDAGRVTACEQLGRSLVLAADEQPLTPRLTQAGLSFPLGAGGLATMREVCTYEAPLASALTAAPVTIAFRDASFQERLGWREIVARGSGVTLRALDGDLRGAGISDRLRQYPADRVASPLADTALLVAAKAGGPTLLPLAVPDASPIPMAGPSTAPSAAPSPDATAPASAVPASAAPLPAVVPGGVTGSEVPDIFRVPDLTPVVVLLSLVTAAALGAGHALTPGHGKTLMAAYLVGTRGSARHALGLGAAVSLSHTIGILALAAVVVAATDVVAPDVVVRWAPVVAAVSIVVIGGWMLVGEIRRRRAVAVHDRDHRHAVRHDHAHPHDHVHPHDHRHPHPHEAVSTISWRSLFVLGLAGGLIPSTSALLILLGAIAAGRPAFGLVLVVAFGAGMAAVMSGIGLVLVAARDRVDRVQAGVGLARIRNAVPLVASVVVLGFGVVLTGQALMAIRPPGL